MLKKYCFDLDNTLCFTTENNYISCTPNNERIKIVNALYDSGNEITIFTARGMGTYKGNISKVYYNLFELTKQQLIDWNIKHHNLILGKPSYDLLICDKAVNSENWFNNKEFDVGLVVGAFDVLHPGYIKMFEQCKNLCKKLIVGLHVDPSIENKKQKPILSVEERQSILYSLKYIDEVVPYNTEKDLLHLLKFGNINVRFLGDDYKDKNFTGRDENIPIVYLNRDHGWSATKYKKIIYEQFKK
jgi:glycerol-3-phosphate cytidylyltransferase